ncbi:MULTISPECIES: GHMP kinase [Streptomyces]|uniref:GHMP kinase n=1 Tax=Streptomyces flaveolus TaxID=67297 RepID=A0ABV3AEY8_9ACTN|nr:MULTISPECIES: GHMP kinase [Streptomyces]KMS85458.1 GHMP kinase [Streptomyces regensis]KOG70098.1 GHMP kinase [Streptomyces antibioticus]MBG7705020.1 GHMP kinase [Streptomyces sp. MC1]
MKIGVHSRDVLSPQGSHGTAQTESVPSALEQGPLLGTGTAPSHHGELLQGVFDDGGRLRRGLVTLPCPLFASNATVRLDRWETELTVTPSWKTKALRAARTTLEELGMGAYGGQLELRGDVAVGRGLGSSTSDVTAAILAVLDAVGRRLPPERIARIAVAAEAATDPLIYADRMLLFAHREGAVIEDFHRPVPPLGVLGFSVTDEEIDTLALPPARYNAWEIECFRALRGLLRRAVAHADHAELGRISTASARINQRFLPVPRFDRLLEIAEESGALGVQVAHSGTVAALLFAPHGPRVEERTALAARRLAELRITDHWRYIAGSDSHVPFAHQS